MIHNADIKNKIGRKRMVSVLRRADPKGHRGSIFLTLGFKDNFQIETAV